MSRSRSQSFSKIQEILDADSIHAQPDLSPKPAQDEDISPFIANECFQNHEARIPLRQVYEAYKVH